jgi:enoyl-CoA hydratase/carnithine racemase
MFQGDTVSKVIRFERDGDVGSIVLANPPHNWLDRQFADDLTAAVHQAGESDIRALLIRAEGADFSAGGAAFDWRPDEDRHWFRTFVAEVNASYRAIEALPIPVVAAVRGDVMGGGFELALSADLIVASETATFICVEVTTGMVPLAGAVQRIAAAAGPFHAARIAMLSQPVTATDAATLNLVAEVVPDNELDKTAAGLTHRFAEGPTKAYAAIKALVKAHAGGGVPAADTLLLDLAIGLYETADARNAIPKVGAALAADQPLPDIEFLGS